MPVALLCVLVGGVRAGAFASAASRGCAARARASPRCAAPAVSFGGIQHVGVLVSDTAASMRFYTDVLGMADDSACRPATLPFGGAFVRAGAHQLHLMQLPNPDPVGGRPEHGGRDRHVAITVESIEPLRASLDAHGIPFTLSMSGRRALFCRDPDGNTLEFLEATAVRAG
jgi:glyoxylase I family protein